MTTCSRPKRIFARLCNRMAYVRWCAGSLLVAAFLLTTVCNLVLVIGWVFREKHSSLVLIVGGLAGLGGFLILPVTTLNRWFWLPIVFDIVLPYGVAVVLSAGKKLVRRHTV